MNFDKDYFNKGNYIPYKDMDVIKKKYFPKIINSINLNTGTKILDIGCAFGYFLKCCDEINCETYGIDISEYAISQARKETKADLYIYDVNNDISIFQNNFFDVITMFDVIEHLESPYSTLKEIRRILKIGGNIIITTPNLNAIERLITRKRWNGFWDESHIYLFYPESLKFLVEHVDFQIEELLTPFYPLPKIFQMSGLGNQIWLVANKI